MTRDDTPDFSAGGDAEFLRVAHRLRAFLSGHTPVRLAVEEFRPAAVLIPVLRRREGPTVLFTLRTEHVNQHKGQISFPGGRVEEHEDARAAALRETYEEVGLDPSGVDVLGELDDYPSVSSYVVTPVVGAVRNPPRSFRAAAAEVLEPFEVPLAHLLDPARLRSEWWDVSRMPPGAPVEILRRLRMHREDHDAARDRYKVYFFDAGRGPDRLIWGLTARILKDLLDRAFAAPDLARGGSSDLA